MMKLQMLDESIDVDDISDCSKMWCRATQSSTNDLFLLLRCRCLDFRLPFSITILFFCCIFGSSFTPLRFCVRGPLVNSLQKKYPELVGYIASLKVESRCRGSTSFFIVFVAFHI